MFNAAILNGTTVVNIIVLNNLSEYAGSVICPEWVCIGDDIDKPNPISEVITLDEPTTLTLNE